MLDPLLQAFLDAGNEAEASRELNALIEQYALPLARTIAERKLRQHREDNRARSAGEPEDAVADAMTTLVERLRTAREDRTAEPIENFLNYVAAVVHSICAAYIRRRYPERARLKNRIRYILSTESRLALWTTERQETACGLAEWRGRRVDPDSCRVVHDWLEQKRLPWHRLSRAEMTPAVLEAFSVAGAPADFDAFAGDAAATAGLIEPRGNDEVGALPSPQPGPDRIIDQQRFLAHVWDEVGNLPVRQRIALLLNLRDTTGSGLLWLLPVTGVASVRQIARTLEMPETEFVRLWGKIPLQDADIAERLSCPRQQVINLRMAARKRLANHLRKLTAFPARGEGNVKPISASLKGSA